MTFIADPLLDPSHYINAGLEVDIPDVDDMKPEIGINGFIGTQRYHVVMIGEKTSLDEVLLPLAKYYKADLFLPSGQLTESIGSLIGRLPVPRCCVNHNSGTLRCRWRGAVHCIRSSH